MRKVSSFQFPVSSFQFPVSSFQFPVSSFLILLFIPFLFVSCEKEITNDLSNTSDALSDIRTELDSTNLIWLEEFRLNLLSTEGQFYYTISEVEYGIETIYNIIGSVGPMKYTNPKIYKDSILIPLTDGVINGSNVKNLSSKIFSLVEGYVFKSNRGFLFVDLNIEQSGSDAIARISVTAGDISEPDLSITSPCEQDYFLSSDCYRSAFGNPRWNGIWGPGGSCVDPNNETSAQLETEKGIIKSIPRVIYSNPQYPNFSVFEGLYKYTNPIQDWIHFNFDLPIYTNPYTDCQDLGSSFIDQSNNLDDIEYSGDRLNCALCLVYDYISSNKPQNKELCDIIITGDFVTGSSSSSFIHWTAEIYYCDVEIIPPSVTWNEPQQPIIDPPTEEDFLMVVSFLDF